MPITNLNPVKKFNQLSSLYAIKMAFQVVGPLFLLCELHRADVGTAASV